MSKSASTEHDDDSALDPAAMLALAETQQSDVQRKLARYVPWILLSWGIAWGVGFALLWLIDGAKPAFSVPVSVAASIFAALMAAALVVSGVLGARSGRGIRTTPAAQFTGTVYGTTWTVGFVAIFVFGGALLKNGMDPALSNIYYPTATTLFVGIMYIIAGAIWRAVQAIAMGGWIVLVALIAPFFGYPNHYLFFAIAGGGVFLVGAVVVAFYATAVRLKGLN
jgi:hypothetical protein